MIRQGHYSMTRKEIQMNCESFNMSKIEKMYKIYKVNIKPTDAASILDISPSATSRYFSVFKSLERGEPITVNNIGTKMIEKFADKHGFKYISSDYEEQDDKDQEAEDKQDSEITLADINKTLTSMRNIFNYMLKYMKTMSEAWSNNTQNDDEYITKLYNTFNKNNGIEGEQ